MMRDAKGLTAEQMNEFRASFNHFDRVSVYEFCMTNLILTISRVLLRIRIEHIDNSCSLESKLFFKSICSI